jgi:glyoxylase-like metal-dependent hydrolase (beta-lactamase superfamily II)/rhodanese-related sulfurtransferase
MTVANNYTNDNSKNNNLRITSDELKKKIDSGEDIFILDVRNQHEHEAWSVSYDRYQDTPVIPVDTITSSAALKQIPKDKEIITFCAHGQRSSSAAKMLSKLGYNVKTIEGGLDGWSNLYDIASIDTDSNVALKIWQIRSVSKGCMSYVIASLKDKKATVIDATCKIETAIKDILEEYGLRITRVIDTHMHADHLSGSTRIAGKYGAEISISSLEKYDTRNLDSEKNLKPTLIRDGEKLEIGDGFYFEAIHTPGHTDGSISFKLQIRETNELKTENDESNSKYFLFSGDTIFVNGVGRPDLHKKSEEYAQKLYQTYRQKLFNLPDKTVILPAHYSLSFEHAKPVFDNIESIKQKLNSITKSEKDFLNYVTSNIPPRPMNHELIVSINENLTSCDRVEQQDLESGPNSCGISA